MKTMESAASLVGARKEKPMPGMEGVYRLIYSLSKGKEPGSMTSKLFRKERGGKDRAGTNLGAKMILWVNGSIPGMGKKK